MESWVGVTVFKKCDSNQREFIRRVCQLIERCGGYREGVRRYVWEGVTVVRKSDSPQKLCHFVGRCDGHGKKGGLGRCTS